MMLRRHWMLQPPRHSNSGALLASPIALGMATYAVQWRLEIDGESPQDAASQAVTNMQERTDTTVTVQVRRLLHGDEHGDWEPVEVGTATSG